MKILNIEDFFHPEAGYQLNVLSKYLVNMGHEVTILTSNMSNVPRHLIGFFDSENIEKKDSVYESKYNVKILRLPVKRFLSRRAVFPPSIFDVILNENPDIVYVHGNTTLIAMQYLLKRKRMNLPFIMDCHMLEIASKNKFKNVFEWVYKHIFTPIIIKDNIQIIRTQDDNYLQKCLNIPVEQCPYIPFGTDVKLFCPNENIRKKYRKKLGLDEDDFVFIYAGKLDESKGGLFLANALMEEIKSKKNIKFIIIGKTNGLDGDKIEKIFNMSKNYIVRLGTQKYEDLAKYYQIADVAIFPKQCSLSFYDVQACGLPVVFENNSINIDRAKNNNALVFKENDINDLRKTIREIADLSFDKFNEMRKASIDLIFKNYNYEDIAKKYYRVLIHCYNSYYNKS